MKLRDGIPEPLSDLCSALGGLGKQTAIETGQPIEETDEAGAAEVIRVLAQALMRYEENDNLGPAAARLALSMACAVATSPLPKAPARPPDKGG